VEGAINREVTPGIWARIGVIRHKTTKTGKSEYLFNRLENEQWASCVIKIPKKNRLLNLLCSFEKNKNYFLVVAVV